VPKRPAVPAGVPPRPPLTRELMQEAEGCERLSDQERIALANRLADAAMEFQRRAIRLSRLAMRVRGGEG